MPRTSLAVFLIASALSAFATDARAIAFEGTFAGVARAVVSPGGYEGPPGSWAAHFDGRPVTGSFRIDIPAPELFDATGSSRTYGFGAGGTLSLRYDIAGHTFRYLCSPANDLDPWMFLDRDVTTGTQALSFRTEYLVRFDGATLAFEAADGRLFDGLDPATFEPTTDTEGIGLRTSFIAPDFATRVEVTTARFAWSAIAAPVPEPSPVALLLAGLVGVGHAVRRQRARGRQPSAMRPACAPTSSA